MQKQGYFLVKKKDDENSVLLSGEGGLSGGWKLKRCLHISGVIHDQHGMH